MALDVVSRDLYSISMKHFKKLLSIPVILAVLLPFLLIAPNIGLDFTERMPLAANVANILLPLSVYAFIFSLWKRVGIMTLLMIPMMCFAGFQIVLLYLYGGSIIGVDMFLNVATTNATEVGELLVNLLNAIGLILILYLPVLILAVISICRKQYLSHEFIKKYRRVSCIALVISILITAGCCIRVKGYSITTHLFPANIFKNLGLAFERVDRLEKYKEVSRDYKYNAISQRPDSVAEVYVMVVGETSRGDNWQLGGYDRDTNPRLSQTDGVVYFPLALTQSNTTHKSVPMIISDLDATSFDDIDSHKSIITAFKEAGYHTYFLSNQRRNRSYTEFFSNEADSVYYLPDHEDGLTFDHELVEIMKPIVNDTVYKKKFIILHTYGSHFNYRDRYPDGFSHFTPDDVPDANLANRDKLINAFDNSIRYIDNYLSEAIGVLDSLDCPSSLIYAADHGEDIFDDSRHRFLHASPIPTSYQLHVPLLVWMSGELADLMPDAVNSLKNNSATTVSSTLSMFHTISTLAGLKMPSLDENLSLTSPHLTPYSFKYVSDRNECLELEDLNLPEIDKKRLSKFNFYQQ